MLKIKAGVIARKKEITKKCEDCGSGEKLIRHHNDYKKPEEIIILCRKCHYRWHKNNKAKNSDDGIKSMMLKIPKELHKKLKLLCIEHDGYMNDKILHYIERGINEDK